jgi:hypothetical protein
MAKRHVLSYYLQVQDLYFEMLRDAKDFDEALKDGFVTQEQVEQSQIMLNKTKDNYERLSYILFLLNQPNREKKIKRHKNQHKELHNHFNDVSQENTIKEIKDDLKTFKEFIKKEKK